MTTNRVSLVLTCGACPEQYDAYIGGEKLGYFRLRHGHFYAEYLPRNEIVYQASPIGDGSFECDERVFHLNRACKALVAHHEHGMTEPVEESPVYDIILNLGTDGQFR